MKNLKTIFKDLGNSNRRDLQNVISTNGNGAYLINGFHEEYGANETERAILVIGGDTYLIISPTRGVLVNKPEGGDAWEPVTRLTDEKIPLADLAEKVMSAEKYWEGNTLVFMDDDREGNITQLDKTYKAALANGAGLGSSDLSISSFKLNGETYYGIGVLEGGVFYYGVAIPRRDDYQISFVRISKNTGEVTLTPILTNTANAINTTNITDKAVTKAKLASDVQTSLGKADTAMQSIADKSITKAKLADEVVNQIDKIQELPESTDLLSPIAEGIYLIRGYKYNNIPRNFYSYSPSILLVGEYDRLLIGKDSSSSGYPIVAHKTSNAATWKESPVLHNELASKQNSTDSTLATTSKTIVGAINEVNATIGNISSVLTNIIGE